MVVFHSKIKKNLLFNKYNKNISNYFILCTKIFNKIRKITIIRFYCKIKNQVFKKNTNVIIITLF